MQVRVLRPGELGEAERAAWRDAQRADPSLASPFLTPEFAAGGRRRPRRRARRRRRRPGDARRSSRSRSTTRAGGPIGATICDAQALVGARTVRLGSAGAGARRGMESWRFDHLVATQQPFAPFHHALHSSPVVDLSAGHDAYLDAVRARLEGRARQVARRRRKLGREVGDVVVEWQTDDDRRSTRCSRGSRRSTARPACGTVSTSRGSSMSCARWRRRRAAADRRAQHPACRRSARRRALRLLGPDRLVWWFPAVRRDVRQLFARAHPACSTSCRRAKLAVASRGESAQFPV